MTSPPDMTTGLMRSRRKGSCVRVLETLSIDELAALIFLVWPWLIGPALVLRPRAYRPYPSCPVPAAGPFRDAFSSGTASGAVFVRLPNRPKRCFCVETFGLGARRPELLPGACGRKSGIIPRPDGAGVASLGEGWIGPGEGFLDGSRDPGADLGGSCDNMGDAFAMPLCLLSVGNERPVRLL